jgi:hypothetical protein
VIPAARSLLAAAVVAVAAFLLYDATLLPGQDLGDSASFETIAGLPIITPRQAYPLYYATGNLFVRALPGEPARALNMASAVFGALACGLLAVVVAALSGWRAAGLVAGLLLAVSYTFWSQAIIAEVYALHAFMMGLCFVALVLWARRPTLPRLVLFFAFYAIGFGNHLSMILLLPGFALFLLLVAPGGPLAMARPRVAVLAIAMAALGASQYLWNFQALPSVSNGDPSLLEQLRTFWFDATKADWRAMMIIGIPEGALRDRTGMYWFDLHQQFGTPGILLALVGIVWMLWPGRLPGGPPRPACSERASETSRRERAGKSASRREGRGLPRVSRPRVGIALLVVFLVNWFFAFTYNVGDAHVFYLPSHFMVALFAGLGAGAVLTLIGGRQRAEGGDDSTQRFPPPASRLLPNAPRLSSTLPVVVGLILLAYPVWRGYDTLPALDRSHDWRAKEFFDKLTTGLDGSNSVFAADLNWQLHNGLDYYAKCTRPELAVVDTTEALLYFPLLMQSNREIGRAMAVTDGAALMLTSAYGPLFDLERDARVPAPSFSERVGRFRPGTSYVLTLLDPYPDNPVDAADLEGAIARLTGNTLTLPASTRYNVIAGRVGEKPTIARFDSRPFRTNARAGGVDVDIRMECWLPADTIRRMGFGRVIVGRKPALTIDRGAGFVAFDGNGGVEGIEYGWAILAPQPRWLIPVSTSTRGRP